MVAPWGTPRNQPCLTRGGCGDGHPPGMEEGCPCTAAPHRDPTRDSRGHEWVHSRSYTRSEPPPAPPCVVPGCPSEPLGATPGRGRAHGGSQRSQGWYELCRRPRAPSMEVPWGRTGCDGPAVPGSPLVGVGTTQPHACKTPRSPRQSPGQGTVPPPSSSPSQSPAAFLPAAENVAAQGLDRTQSGVWTWPPRSEVGMDAERGSATNSTRAEGGSPPSVTASVLSAGQDQPGMLQPG